MVCLSQGLASGHSNECFLLTFFLPISLQAPQDNTPAFTYIHSVLWCKHVGVLLFFKPHKSAADNNNNTEGETESQTATAHSSVAPPVSLKGSFALTESLPP